MRPAIGKVLTGVFYTLLWLLALAVMFRSFFLSGGDQIVGDVADGQLIQFIHEHWFRVFSGLEEWRNLNIFYPVNDTLGYSDTFFLQGIPYSALRFLGVDMFIAFQLVQMLLASAGFWGMLVWLRKCRGIHPALAGWGALLFVIASPFYLGIRNSHIQLLAIWLLPVILIFFEQTLTRLSNPDKSLKWNFLLFTFLFGGLVYSTFYAAFFLILGLTIALVSSLIVYGPKKILSFLWPPKAGWKSLIPGLIVFFVWMGLFLWTYLPVRQDMGGRSLSSVMNRIPFLWDTFNHSDYNLVWGFLNKLIWAYPDSYRWSFELCIPLATLMLACAASVLVIRNRAKWKLTNPALLLSGYVLIVSLLLSFRIGPVSLWVIPYYLLPGADAIRVVPRYNLALMIPVIFLISYFIQSLWTKKSLLLKLTILLLVSLVTLEQLQLVENSNISREERSSVMDRAHAVPADVEAFYAIGKPMWGWHKAAPHNTAMMLSQAWGIPTLNGRSGFSAKDWPLFEMDPEIAFPAMKQWAQLKGITGRLFVYNLDTGRWFLPIDFSSNTDGFSLYQDLMNLPAKRFSSMAVSGWSAREHWGVWSREPNAVIKFPGMALSSNNQVLALTLVGFVNEEQPQYDVAILLDGKEIYRPHFNREKPQRSYLIPVTLESGIPWTLEFSVVDPAPPGKFDLGVGIISLVVEE